MSELVQVADVVVEVLWVLNWILAGSYEEFYNRCEGFLLPKQCNLCQLFKGNHVEKRGAGVSSEIKKCWQYHVCDLLVLGVACKVSQQLDNGNCLLLRDLLLHCHVGTHFRGRAFFSKIQTASDGQHQILNSLLPSFLLLDGSEHFAYNSGSVLRNVSIRRINANHLLLLYLPR